MSIAKGTSLVFSIAQRPYGVQQNFSTLTPLAFLDGELADRSEFPSRGVVFWRKSGADSAFLNAPGALVVAQIELADASSAQDSYRTISGTCRIPNESQLIEFIDASSVVIEHPAELLTRDLIIPTHSLTPFVIIRTNLGIFGPFKADAGVADITSNTHRVVLTTPAGTVNEFDEQEFLDFEQQSAIRVSTPVSLLNFPPAWSSEVISCSYSMLLPPAIEQLKNLSRSHLTIRSPEQVLRPLIRKYGDMKKFHQVDQLLGDFLSDVISSRSELSGDEIEVISNLQASISKDRKLTRDLTDAILASGLLQDKIEERLEMRARQHIEERSAELLAQIKEGVRVDQKRLDALKADQTRIQDELDRKRADFEARLRAEDSEHEARQKSDTAALNALTMELNAQQDAVKLHLEEVTRKFEVSREVVVNDFLALMPLLQRTNMIQNTSAGNNADFARNPDPKPELPFQFPVYARPETARSEYAAVNECEFFERFASHTRAKGFRYRKLDLLSYHQNYKMSEFMILGGPSGTGKSSLPALYAEAMHGSNEVASLRTRRVAVSPTWLDFHDFLGRVNALEHRFKPAESGAFRFILAANEELKIAAGKSGMHTLVLDEMNLAQVEHYFGPFLQVFGTLEESKPVDVFDISTIDSNSSFAQFATIYLPATLRFVGTVNFDETTRPLSIRVLDRGPLIRIEADALHETTGTIASVSVQPITFRHIRDWTSVSNKLGTETLQLLDKIKLPLRALGCPLTPRTETAIPAFLSTMNREICTEEEALDLALAQRVVPKIRGLFKASSRESFQNFVSILTESTFEFTETDRLIAELRESEFALTEAD